MSESIITGLFTVLGVFVGGLLGFLGNVYSSTQDKRKDLIRQRQNNHKELNKVIKKSENQAKVIEMILNLHKELHTSKVSESKDKNIIDTLFEDMQQNEYAIMPTAKDETIAWAIWHIARIEDLAMNILVNNSTQIFDESWKKRMSIGANRCGFY